MIERPRDPVSLCWQDWHMSVGHPRQDLRCISCSKFQYTAVGTALLCTFCKSQDTSNDSFTIT